MLSHTGTEVDAGAIIPVRLLRPATSEQASVDPPTVDGVPAVSDAGPDGRWTEGEAVEVTLTFSEAVDVDTAGGTPTVGIALGGTEARSASWVRGTGTDRAGLLLHPGGERGTARTT